jgi:excinuclease ABC subunit A
VYVPCEVCHGALQPETLRSTTRGKSIAEVLDMSIEALGSRRTSSSPGTCALVEVGLGYVGLQPAPTLSGGEAQRVNGERAQ